MSLDDVELNLIESLDDVDEFRRWLGQRRPAQVLGFDTETSGLQPHRDVVRLAQIGDEQTGWAIPWDRWSGVLEDTVARWDGIWTAHNAPFDGTFLSNEGIEMPRERVRDTRIMSHILEPTMSTALKKQAARHVDPRAGAAQTELDEALGKKGGWTWGTIPVKFLPYWSYAALDPVLGTRLHNRHWPRVQEEAPRAFEIENAVQWVTRDMERYGTHIDVSYAREHRDKFLTFCENVKKWCKDEYNVSPGSNAAIVQILQRAGYSFTKATASGAVSLDKEVLGGIDHPLAKTILEYRQLQKLAKTYLTHYIDEVDENDCIHPSINTLGARTSRMSMSEPNMQNLPRASETNRGARVIRNCIAARENHTLLFCDFGQIEMRGLAVMSGDVNMIKAFKSEGDFFVNLSRQVYRDDTIDKKHPLRQRIKNVGYAKIYGAGIAKLAQTAGISEQQVRETLAAFDSEFPGVATFQNDVFRTAMRRKEELGRAYAICPLTGRRHPADPGKEYALVNFLIQGWAAALFKIKLLELDAAGLGPWMMLVVHDEIILDVPNDYVPGAVDVLQRVMNDYTSFPVPIQSEVSYGARWGEKRDWDYDRWSKEMFT